MAIRLNRISKKGMTSRYLNVQIKLRIIKRNSKCWVTSHSKTSSWIVPFPNTTHAGFRTWIPIGFRTFCGILMPQQFELQTSSQSVGWTSIRNGHKVERILKTRSSTFTFISKSSLYGQIFWNWIIYLSAKLNNISN